MEVWMQQVLRTAEGTGMVNPYSPVTPIYFELSVTDEEIKSRRGQAIKLLPDGQVM